MMQRGCLALLVGREAGREAGRGLLVTVMNNGQHFPGRGLDKVFSMLTIGIIERCGGGLLSRTLRQGKLNGPASLASCLIHVYGFYPPFPSSRHVPSFVRGSILTQLLRKGIGVDMVKVCLLFVPADGAEVDHEMYVDLPAAPEVCDSLLLGCPPETGYESFVVKRRWWILDTSSNIDVELLEKDVAARLVVECHYAYCEKISEAHRDTCNRYEGHGMAITKLAKMPF